MITGTGDHLRPEWPITITGMRTDRDVRGDTRLIEPKQAPTPPIEAEAFE